ATIQETVQAGQMLHRLRFEQSDALELYDFPGEYAQRFDGVDSSGGQRPGELFKIREEAQRTVDIRMQEEAAQSLVIRGTSTSVSLVSGHKFTLTEHVNGNGSYVLTSVHHRATDSTAESRQDSYANSFT